MFALVQLCAMVALASQLRDLRAEDVVVGTIMMLSLGAAYWLLLLGVIYDSPTLSVIKTIQSHGALGMPVSAFDDFVVRHPFVRSRVDALLAGRHLLLVDGTLVLTRKAAGLLAVGDIYARLRADHPSETG